MRLLSGCLALLLSFSGIISLRGQDPALADDDLAFTKNVLQQFHSVAWVSLEKTKGRVTQYQYDCYPATASKPEVERIKINDASYARTAEGRWRKSDDWGRTGSEVNSDRASELDFEAEVLAVPFAAIVNYDSSQGKNVWKFVEKTNRKDNVYYTYERSREHPRADGVYPQFTFMKATTDVDGRLFLREATGRIRLDRDRIPFRIQLNFLVPIPAGTKVEIRDQHTGKIEYSDVVKADSGFEMTSAQSDPAKATSEPVDQKTVVRDFAPGADPAQSSLTPK